MPVLTVFIPFRTKSAATLIALAADELVIGSLGELGPLDAQYEERRAHDFPLEEDLIALVRPSAKTIAAALKVVEGMSEPAEQTRPVAQKHRRGRGRSTSEKRGQR